MNKSEEINELADALSRLQGEVHNAFKDRIGHKCKYADLGSILDIARPLLCKHSLSVTQLCGSSHSGSAEVETVLMHKSGQWISSLINMGVEKGSMSMAQAVGSVITYARRYSLAAILGIAQTDDDASLKGQYHEEPANDAPDYKAILNRMLKPSGKGDDEHIKLSDKVMSWLEPKGLTITDLTQDQAHKILSRL